MGAVVLDPEVHAGQARRILDRHAVILTVLVEDPHGGIEREVLAHQVMQPDAREGDRARGIEHPLDERHGRRVCERRNGREDRGQDEQGWEDASGAGHGRSFAVVERRHGNTRIRAEQCVDVSLPVRPSGRR